MKALRVALRQIEDTHSILESWGLEGLTTGKPVTLYHGSTASFDSFEAARSRHELVEKYTGGGIFLTPDKAVARLYADSNRNIGLDPKIISQMKRKNPKAGKLLEDCYKQGNKVWDNYEADELNNMEVDPNSMLDLSLWILGTKYTQTNNDPVHIFSQNTGMPEWVYDLIDQVGLKSFEYRPKVYTVSVTVSNTLVTDKKSEAKKAFQQGYDCFVFYGSDLVRGVPEVAVSHGQFARIKGVELAY